jgi:S1-C subfamily serine protease
MTSSDTSGYFYYPPQGPPPGAAPEPPARSARRRNLKPVLSGFAAGVLAAGLVFGGVAAANSGSTSVSGTGSVQGLPSLPVIPNFPKILLPQSGSGSGQRGVTPATAKQEAGVVTVNSVLRYQNAESAGTGMILSSDGEVLTNNHVIRGSTSISATVVSTGRTYQAVVVGYDIGADVAVLQLQGASGLPTARIGDSAAIAVGDAVLAVGNVGGTGGSPTISNGSVTALNQTITASDESNGTSEDLTGMIETDASVRPGDSGGPLLNAGRVVGIDTAGSDGFSIESGGGAGFAIPIDTAVGLARQIEARHGTAAIHIGATAFLGVSVRANPAGNGALVAGVVGGSPAESAGIAAGDTVTSIDGSSVDSPNGLADLLVVTHPGQRVQVGWTDSGGTAHSAALRLASGPAA